MWGAMWAAMWAAAVCHSAETCRMLASSDRVVRRCFGGADIPVARSAPRGYGGSMGRHLWIVVLLCACGEPILKNAPKPDPGAVAGVAAAAAAAATLAAPDAAAKKQEQKTKGEPDNRGVVVKETVPAAVFDRLDQRTVDAGVDGAPAAEQAHER